MQTNINLKELKKFNTSSNQQKFGSKNWSDTYQGMTCHMKAKWNENDLKLNISKNDSLRILGRIKKLISKYEK